MHSHRRPRGRIFFEVVCALTVGASFVGAWIQTGAWAFVGPAFVFTLFGLYWSFDLFGARNPAPAVQPAVAPVRVADPETAMDMESAVMPEIRFERFEAPAEPAPEPVVDFVEQLDVHTDAVPFVSEPEPEPVVEAQPKAKVKKPRAAKKAAEPVVEQAPSFAEEPHYDQHIEPLFEPQPFARQARPAFGKRPRGPGPRPLPAA